MEREVTLECIVEVYPKPLNGWYRNEGTIEHILSLIKAFLIILIYIIILLLLFYFFAGNVKLHNGNKYNISEAMINLYMWHLNLTIRHLTKADFGAYSCSSVNALGKSETRIRLQGNETR